MTVENLSTQARSVVISMNPGSGAVDARKLVQRLADELVQRNFQPIVLTDLDQVRNQVAQLFDANELKTVVAAGGDGTVTLLAGMLPAGTPLAVLPLGTENLLAKHLGLKPDPVELARLIEAGSTMRIDAGRANGELFLVMASCGFDAEVVHRLHAGRTGHIRHWSYAGPIVGAIGQYRYPKIKMWVDENPDPISAKWAFVFNVPRYAMNLPIVSDAEASDGMLDLCTFRGGKLMRGLFYFLAIVTGQHRRWRKDRVCRFRKIRIESVEPVPFQLDGDPGGHLPLEIEVLPGFLKLVVGGSQDFVDQ